MPLVSFTAGEKLTATKLNSVAQQAYDALTGVSSGGTIDGVAIGGTTPAAGAFTTLAASGAVSGAGFTALFASPPAIGGTAPAAGSFTTLAASGALSGAGFDALFASPPAMGATAPGAATIGRLRIGASGTPAALPQMFLLQSATGNPNAGTQVFRVGGNFFGALTSSLVGVFQFVADSDTMTVSDPNTMGVTWNDMAQNVSTGWSGGRVTHKSRLNVTGAGTGGAHTFQVAGASFATASAEAGGTAGSTKGNLFGRNDSAEIKAGAGYDWLSCVGDEINVAIEATAAAAWKTGFKIVQWSTDARRGRIDDFAYGIGMQASGTAPGWRVGFQLGAVSGWWPFTTDSTIFGSRTSFIGGGLSRVAAVGIDLEGITFGKAAFQSASFRVDGAGNVGGLVLGGTALHTRSAIAAGTATVAGIDVMEGGLFDGAVTLTVSAPEGSGSAATATVAEYALGAVGAFPAGGSGYAVGNELTLSGGTGTAAKITVSKVNGSGAVQSAYVSLAGAYTALPAGPVSLTGGAGSGATLTPLWSIATGSGKVTVGGGGSNYSPYLPPQVASAGAAGTLRPALLKPVMSAASVVPLALNAGKINVAGIPTSASGLASGDVYSNSGVLTVVP